MEERQHATDRERDHLPLPDLREPDTGSVADADERLRGAADAYDVAVETPESIGAGDVLRLQQAAGNSAVGSLVAAISDGGAPLDATMRTDMERDLGADFSSVRVHTGADAARSASELSALAYTTGEDVVLGGGIDASTAAGRHTLAHELSHVRQQREGPVAGTVGSDGIAVSDPGDSFELAAAEAARRVTAPVESP